MKKRFTEEKIIRIIKEQESGIKVEDLCRQYNIWSNSGKKTLTRPLGTLSRQSGRGEHYNTQIVRKLFLALPLSYCFLEAKSLARIAVLQISLKHFNLLN